MKTGLKKSQKTTIIEFDEQGPRITVSTHNTDLKNRLGAYARRWPECCREADDDGWGCKTFEIDKGRFCFRLTAPSTDRAIQRGTPGGGEEVCEGTFLKAA